MNILRILKEKEVPAKSNEVSDQTRYRWTLIDFQKMITWRLLQSYLRTWSRSTESISADSVAATHQAVLSDSSLSIYW